MKIFSMLLLLALISCNGKLVNKDQVILDRIEYIYHLKSRIAQIAWAEFDKPEFDVPLIHYQDSVVYIANPTEKFLKIFKPEMVLEKGSLKIFRMNSFHDINSFHLETAMSFDDPESYDYQSPFMKCSSFEKTKNTIPDVLSTEQWITMVIHEYFHGFQNKHPKYLNHLGSLISVSEDSLKSIYKQNLWFKNKVDQENDYLLMALQSNDDSEAKQFIQAFFRLRDDRRKMAKEKLNIDLIDCESTYETMEGTARYVEFSLYKYFAENKSDMKLLQSDKSFHSFRYFKNYKIEKDPWLYLSSRTGYFYATGFNITRLLDKFKIDYKSNLFHDPNNTLEQLLRTNFDN